MTPQPQTTDPTHPFFLQRTLNFPRALVFQAFTQPEHLLHWWGPKGSSIEVVRLDLHKQGMFLYSMEQGGQKMYGRFVYQDIKAPERLSYTSAFSDENGNAIRALPSVVASGNPQHPDF